MKTVKEIIKSSIVSIGIAMAIFCIVGIIFDIRSGGAFSMEGFGFTKMVLGCLAIGLGFGVPSVVYNNDNLARPVQMVIHMGIGCAVYTATAWYVGWLGDRSDPGQCLILLGAQLALAFLIWLGFIFFYRNEAKKIYEKIASMNP